MKITSSITTVNIIKFVLRRSRSGGNPGRDREYLFAVMVNLQQRDRVHIDRHGSAGLDHAFASSCCE